MQKHEWLAVVTLCTCFLFLTIISHFSSFSHPFTTQITEEVEGLKIIKPEKNLKSQKRKVSNKKSDKKKKQEDIF